MVCPGGGARDQFYVKFDIYIPFLSPVSLRSHNLSTFYTRKLKFGKLLILTCAFHSVLELPLGHALGWA